MHKFDKGVIEHKNVEIVQLKLDHQKAVNDALVWATEKQKVYDNAAIQSARQDAARQQQLAAAAHRAVTDLQSFLLACLFAAALLTSSCASSTAPLSPVGRQAPFPSPPENLLTPARPLTPLLWCDGCSVS
jgi:replication fork clamp-binding protein CrfC